jgi:hypothetical protein
VTPVTAVLSTEQRSRIVAEFHRKRRSDAEAQQLLSKLPEMLSNAVHVRENHADMRRLQNLRGPAPTKKNVADVERAIVEFDRLIARLDRLEPVARKYLKDTLAQSVEKSGDELFTGGQIILGLLRDLFAGKSASFRTMRLEPARVGHPVNEDERSLLTNLARHFIARQLPVTQSQDGLFVAIARILLPGERTTIHHSLLRAVITAAKSSPQKA